MRLVQPASVLPLVAISFGVVLRQSGVVTASLVERMVPDSGELFERVVPPALERPQDRGRRRRGDQEVLAAITFVATSGCTWNQLPPDFGLSRVTRFRRFTAWSEAKIWAQLHRLVLDGLGSRGELDWFAVSDRIRQYRALKGGLLTGSNPISAARADRKSTSSWTGTLCHLGRDLRRQPPRQPGPHPLVRGIPPIRFRRNPDAGHPRNYGSAKAASCSCTTRMRTT